LADELITEFGEDLTSITLLKSSEGRFEVSVDDKLMFSKAELKRHAQPGEVVEQIRKQQASGRLIQQSTH
jgi:selT/selW/selH-like putative selenoprotein